MTTAAAIKAWETRRARAAGTAPLPQLKPVSADRSAAAHKAWETIRAKKAAQASAPITTPLLRPERVKVERITALTPPSSITETAGQKAAATRKAIEGARLALREFFAQGGTIHTIPAGQRTLDPPLTFGDIQKHHGLREVAAV